MSDWSLTEEEKGILLKLARMKLESVIGGREIDLDSVELTSNLREKKGCFVSLHKNGSLRGCVGRLMPQKELYVCVMDNVVHAAFHDSRFSRVTEEELGNIKVEITVLLSAPKKLDFSSGEDLKNKLRPGVDGVILKRLFHQSTYIPQVWESTPDKEEFLSSLCVKGGMKPDCWTDTSTGVYVYQTIYFSE